MSRGLSACARTTVLTVVAAGLVGVGVAPPAGAVVGEPVGSGVYPFLAKIDVGDQVRACSGVLVAPQWVLTARTCFGAQVTAGAPELLSTVRVGRNPLSGNAGHEVSVVEVVPRGERNAALVKLAYPVTDVVPVAVGSTAPGGGEVLRVAGFGRTATEWVPDVPHSADYGVSSVAAGTVAVAPVGAKAGSAGGDAGGPALRLRGAAVEVLGVMSAAWPGGCFGETETRRDGTLARVDDLGEWVRATTAERPSPAGFGWRNQLHVFSRAQNGELAHWWLTRGGRVERNSWGRQLVGNPAAVADGDEQHVFGRGPDGSLRHWNWNARNPDRVGYETWAGPKITSDPVAYFWKGEQHVFARAEDGSLAHWIWAGALRHDNWGGQLVGNPAGFADGEQQHVFARDKDSRLVHWVWDARAEKLTHEVWQGPKISSDPTGYLWQGQQHVFARGLTGTLEHWLWAGAFKQDNWGGQVQGKPTGFPFGEQQHVLGGGPGGELRHWVWDARRPEAVDRETWAGPPVTGDPSAHVWFDEQRVFALGADGELGHWWWEDGKPVQHVSWGK